MSKARVTVAALLLCTTSCQGVDDVDVELEMRAGPRPVADDLGPRVYETTPHYRQKVCPDGTACTTADVNSDGKDDLVRFDNAGVFGPPGTVSIGYSNGWDFGAMTVAAEDFCEGEDACFAADVNGDLRADLIRFIRPLGEVEVALAKEGGFYSPFAWAEGICNVGQTCSAGDVNGDGLADLVAFEGAGKGYVYVSVSDPKKFGHAPAIWAEGFCTNAGDQCRLGDVDGNGVADIAEMSRGAQPVTTIGRSNGQWFEFDKSPSWSNLACPADATCELADFTGDFYADVIAHYPESATVPADSCSGSCGTAAPAWCWCDDLCTQYGDCCADHNAICEQQLTCSASCGTSAPGGCWCDAACTSLGDCCSDYAPHCNPTPRANAMEIWPAVPEFEGFDPGVITLDTGCSPGDRCWSADVTGDGRVDLLVIGPDGTLELFHSQDSVDRLADNALRLSLLRTSWERRRQEVAHRERIALVHEAAPIPAELVAAAPELFPPILPPSAPTPDDPAPAIPPLPDMEPWPGTDPGAVSGSWYAGAARVYAQAIEDEAESILDAVPPEGTLVESADQQRWQEALGKVVAARTALFAPPLAASAVSRGGACNNAILHDRPLDDDFHRVEGSYLARYFDALREHDASERIWQALPALTGVVEGMRCLSETELAGLEAALVEAVAMTMNDLLDRGQPALAQVLWDQTLPLELILFDGVKTYAAPQGWRLLQARIEGGAVVLPPLPDPGDDFNAFFVEDGATCSTIRCQLYKSARRETASGQFLTLDTLGVWLPDLTQRERLRRSSLYPELLLDAMVDLESLGEGDCALIELGPFNRTCKSRRTCEFAQELAAMPNVPTLTLLPGAPGSAFTHFGTRRSDLASVNECGSDGGGGGPAPSSCAGPELRGHRGRFAPLDPELDAIVTCTLEAFTQAEPTATPVLVDLDFDPKCLLADPPEDGAPTPSGPPATDAQIETARQAVVQLLESNTGAARAEGFNRDDVVAIIAAKFGIPASEVLNAMDQTRSGTLGDPAGSWVHGTNSGSSMETRTVPNTDGSLNSMRMAVDLVKMGDDIANVTDGEPAELHDTLVGQYLMAGVLHEAIHQVLNYLSDSGFLPALSQANDGWHHDITNALGLIRAANSCAPDSTTCRTGCGFADARMKRFVECLAGGEAPPLDRCEFAPDYCEDRTLGGLDFVAGGSCGAPSIAFPPMCAAVSCDTSSDVASACCGTGGGGGGEPPPYPEWSGSPGPHPGDPDGPYGGIPGGPGGVPFPPVPPPGL